LSEIIGLSSTLDVSALDISVLAASPLQQLHSSFLEKTGVQLYVKRDDLIHPQFGGNKWRKLKYNLIHARENHYHTLLTFGGAWSNHIYATAAAARHFGFNSIGIIRGEQHTPLNDTLSFAKACGMQLHYVSRSEYRHKHETAFQQKLKQQFGNIYILPEGGSNALALKGCEQIVQEINSEIEQAFDIICCASGTGATLAGLITAIEDDPEKSKTGKMNTSAIGFSALKGGDFLNHEVKSFLSDNKTQTNWRIEDRFHFGGYAKITDELIHFMQQFQSQYGFALDAVYTGKMFYGLFKLIEEKSFKPGTTIVAIHSGGLQGNKGFNL
jgi:1-aminocyclopropane-1-carboxylate deaminase/D-cysteine desulfhydrase-like pyridoxal-dependent ACC family enzyme